MQMQLVKEGIHNYMVVLWEQEWQENYVSRLFQFHKVPYFLPYEVRSMNEQIYLYYSLQIHTSLRSVMGHLPFTYERVSCMVESILDVFDVVEEYFIEPEGIVWDSQAIYIDVESGRLQFAYCQDGKENGDLRSLITEILQYIDKKQDDIVLLVMGLYDIVTEQKFHPNALRDFREEFRKRGVSKVPYHLESESALWQEDAQWEESESRRKDLEGEYSTKGKECHKSDPTQAVEKRTEKKHGKKKSRFLLALTGFVACGDLILIMGLVTGMLSFLYMRYCVIGIILLVGLLIGLLPDQETETVDDIMEEYQRQHLVQPNPALSHETSNIGETSLLSETDSGSQTLVVEHEARELYLEALEKDRYPRIRLQNGSVVIGSMAEGCTYVLKERGISRLHAKLMEKADGIYLLDLNSTNGTYLNGEEIEAGKDYKIEEGDMIAFARCEYYVVADIAALPQAI